MQLFGPFQSNQTALMLAVKHGKADLVELLLENGAAVNLQDADGSTAVMCAVEHEFLNIVKLILAKPECDVNIADNVRMQRIPMSFDLICAFQRMVKLPLALPPIKIVKTFSLSCTPR